MPRSGGSSQHLQDPCPVCKAEMIKGRTLEKAGSAVGLSVWGWGVGTELRPVTLQEDGGGEASRSPAE